MPPKIHYQFPMDILGISLYKSLLCHFLSWNREILVSSISLDIKNVDIIFPHAFDIYSHAFRLF